MVDRRLGQRVVRALQAQQILELKKRLNINYLKHTKQKIAAVEKALDRDNFMTSEQALEWGIIDKIIECNQSGQPLLVFTASINKSEHYSQLLKQKGTKHIVLNAKNHEREAEIIANAGKIGSIIITTSISGRGVDIQLGGKKGSVEEEKLNKEKEEVKSLGGLFVIGTERMESRRVDNQARGRSGRQGDEGNSIFYVSLEDDLMLSLIHI